MKKIQDFFKDSDLSLEERPSELGPPVPLPARRVPARRRRRRPGVRRRSHHRTDPGELI